MCLSRRHALLIYYKCITYMIIMRIRSSYDAQWKWMSWRGTMDLAFFCLLMLSISTFRRSLALSMDICQRRQLSRDATQWKRHAVDDEWWQKGIQNRSVTGPAMNGKISGINWGGKDLPNQKSGASERFTKQKQNGKPWIPSIWPELIVLDS